MQIIEGVFFKENEVDALASVVGAAERATHCYMSIDRGETWNDGPGCGGCPACGLAKALTELEALLDIRLAQRAPIPRRRR